MRKRETVTKRKREGGARNKKRGRVLIVTSSKLRVAVGYFLFHIF